MRVLKHAVMAWGIFALAPLVAGSAFAGSGPVGIWLNDTGRGAVEIKECGKSLCGNVVWVKSAGDAKGCGKQVIGDVAPQGGNRWDKGWIYSPEKDRRYDVELTALANGNLQVVGYAGLKFLSKTMIWKPAPADLKLCSGTTAAGTTASATPTPAPAKPDARKSDAAEVAKVAPEAKPHDSKPVADEPATAEVDKKDVETAKPAESNSDEKTARNDDSNGNENDEDSDNGIAGALGKLKIGDLKLDKVLTRTKNGKCRLDLPWVKVTLNCEQE
jgi:uncharacterized protein (DUF2147 family)